jgi:hypothetical protein
MNRFETVTWSRRRSAVSGCAALRGTSTGAGRAGGSIVELCSSRSEVGTGEGDTAGASGRSTGGWSSARRAVGAGIAVTTVRCGAASIGASSAETACASRREQRRNLGRTSSRFSGVNTFANSMMLVMQSVPTRSGSTTSGTRWMSSAAVFL